MRSVRVFALLATAALGAPLAAQTTPAPLPQSLVVDPQQGATPPPIERSTTPPPSTPQSSLPALPQAPAGPTMVAPQALPPVVRPAGQDGTVPRSPALSLDRGQGLPAPSRDPLRIDAADDPILASLEGGDRGVFSAAIRAVVARHPAIDEAEAREDEARAARNEARTLELPVIDFSMSYFNVLDRNFSNDPQNILERSRPRERTDELLRVQQPIWDFGNARNRIRAGNQRLMAATSGIDDISQRLVMNGVQTWYQVFAYRALVRLAEAFVANQADLRAALQTRIEQGVSAPGDMAQFTSYGAAAQAQLANYRRQLASAEAQYRLLTGTPVPLELGRAPSADFPAMSREAAEAAAVGTPAVESARRIAAATRFEAKAVRATMKPTIGLGVDAGRYGVFENDGDYDVRASFVLSQRFLGGAKQRGDQAAARARGSEATYERVREEAVRDASTAWSDVSALQQSAAAIRENYIATRQSRDVLFQRFQVSRGNLFDVLSAQTNYFNVAVSYIQTVTELDIARYTLLARTGKLLDTFDIAPAAASAKPVEMP